MPDENGSPDDNSDSLLDPAVVVMMADDLDERANTLQNEAERLHDNAEQLRGMAQELRNK